jgi:hypothetical protein
VRVPEEVEKGKAIVTVSFAEWQAGNVAPATYEVPIVDPSDVTYGALATQSVTLEDGIPERTPLKDVLTFLKDRYDISKDRYDMNDLIIDEEAFRKAGIPDVKSLPVKLPPQERVPLSSVLTKLFEQIGGKYEIRNRTVVIVPAPRRP